MKQGSLVWLETHIHQQFTKSSWIELSTYLSMICNHHYSTTGVTSLRSHVDKGPGAKHRCPARIDSWLQVGTFAKQIIPEGSSPTRWMSDDPPSSECSNPHHNLSVWHRPWNGATGGKWRMELVLPSGGYHDLKIITYKACCCGSEIVSWNSRRLLPDMYLIKFIQKDKKHPSSYVFARYEPTNSFLVVSSRWLEASFSFTNTICMK